MAEEQASDAELIARVRQGDPEAVHALYERHGPVLLRLAAAMTHSRQAAEDIVHDAFVELMRRPPRFDASRGPLIAWLYGIARHRMARVLREAVRAAELGIVQPPESAPEPLEAPGGPGPSTEEEVGRAQLIAQVRLALLDLPLVHREVIALCDLEELPYGTVAQILDCPIGTVRSRLHRARALLAIRLAALGEFDEASGRRPAAPATGPASVAAPRDAGGQTDAAPAGRLLFSYRSTPT